MANTPEPDPHEVTRILQSMRSGEERSSDALIPLVYHELRHLAAYHMQNERPGQTLQPTALVHEAYLRLVRSEDQTWENRRHFIAAAAEAMRRVLIDNARRKAAQKRGESPDREDMEMEQIPGEEIPADLLDFNEALKELEAEDAPAADVVKLRLFAGLTRIQIAEVHGISERSVDNLWLFGRTWLNRRLDCRG